MSYLGMDIPPARPRPRPQNPTQPDASRDSNALRASVLDAAMQLGLGNNPAVADWMFNNQLKEEDEDQIPTSPGLTHSEESPSSSPLSSRYPLTPSSPSSQNHTSSSHHAHKNYGNFHLQPANTVPFAISHEAHTFIPHITDPANVPARPSTPSKLKKKRSANRFGYESDDGTTSDAKRKKDKKKDKEKAKENALVPPNPGFFSMPTSSANSFLTLETASDLTIDGNVPQKLKKSMTKNSSITRSAPASPLETSSIGYETDSSKKSKKKSKGLFFRLGNKSSKELKKSLNAISVRIEKNSSPPPLPIAERFATTLNKDTGAPMIGLGPREIQSSSGSSGPGSALGIDLALGLSGDMFTTNHPPPPRSKMPARPRTADSVMSSSPHPHSRSPAPPLPSLSIPPRQLNTPPPPVSFPSSSSAIPYGPRPGSAGTATTSRTSTSTNTHSYSTGAARTSYATSVSTSHSHPPHPTKGVMLSRESSNTDVRGLTSVSGMNAVPFRSQTPTKKRKALPFLCTPGNRGSSSSGDSVEKEKKLEEIQREKERESEREKERKEKERELEREKGGKKSLISLPLTRAPSDASEVTTTQLNPARNPSVTPAPLIDQATPLRPRPNGSPADNFSGSGAVPLGPRAPSHPPVSHHFQNHGSLSRQVSLSQLQSQAQPIQAALSRQVSLSTLRPDGFSPNDRASPVPMARPTPPLTSERMSPLPRGPGINGMGSTTGTRLTALSNPPNVFVHHDIPPPSPPPLAPLPSVPITVSHVPPTPISTSNGNHNGSPNGHLSMNVGIALTTGSPLPSPLLMTSPNFNGGPNGAGKVPPTSFNPSSAAAGNALRAKVQRRLSQQEGFPTPSSGATSPIPDSCTPSPPAPPAQTLPVVQAPTLSRTTSIRGRESPFPVVPISKGHSPTNTLTVNSPLPPRAISPRSGWEDNSFAAGREAEYDDDGMDDVRGVIARFRESRIDGASRKKMEGRNVPDVPIARNFDAYQQNNFTPSASGSSLNGNVPVSPSPSSNLMGVNSDTASGKYDHFAIDDYYGHGGMNSNMGIAPSSFAAFENEDLVFEDDDLEDASYYPEDENPSSSNRRSRRRRSTVYLSDEEQDNSSNSGHGHGGKERSSRYSASIYSRASFLDTEKSGEVRQRFLKHVEAMLDERGQRVPAVPPVPKLPEEFVAESRRAAANARKEYEELMVQRTIGVGVRKVPTGIPVNVGQ